MKKIFIILIISNSLYAQNVNFDSVKAKYIADKSAYILFLELGRCNCLDILLNKKNKTFFEDYFFALYDTHYALPRMIEKEKMKSAFDAYYKNNINDMVSLFKKRDEKIKLHFHSPFLFCNKLFEKNDKTKEMYQNFINDSNSYTQYYFDEYLNDRLTNE